MHPRQQYVLGGTWAVLGGSWAALGGSWAGLGGSWVGAGRASGATYQWVTGKLPFTQSLPRFYRSANPYQS